MSRRPKFANDLLVGFGEMRAEIKNLTERGAEASGQNEKILDKLDGLDKRLAKIEPAVEDMQPHIERFKKYEQWGVAAFAITTFCGSVFGGWILRKLGWEI